MEVSLQLPFVKRHPGGAAWEECCKQIKAFWPAKQSMMQGSQMLNNVQEGVWMVRQKDSEDISIKVCQ